MKFQILTPEVIHEQPQGDSARSAVSPRPTEAEATCRFFAVCDGMPQHAQSGKAAESVCRAMERCMRLNADAGLVFSDADLDELLRAAREQLDTSLSRHDRDAATSMALLLLHRGGALMAHIGNCRIYHVRPSKGALLYRSADDVLAHSGKLAKAMQPHDDTPADLTVVRTTDVRPGDRFLVCSRSVADGVGETALTELLADPTCNLGSVSGRMCDLLDANRDECAAELVELGAIALEPSDASQPDEEAQYMAVPAATPVAATPAAPAPVVKAGPAPAPEQADAPAAAPKAPATKPKAAPTAAAPATAPRKAAPAEKPKKHEGLRAVRNWVLSLVGIVFVIFAMWYVFGNDSAPASETIEMDTAAPAADTAATQNGPIDWLGTGSDTPTGDADARPAEKEKKKEETPKKETADEESVSEEDLTGEKSEPAAHEPAASPTPAPETHKKEAAEPANAAPASANTSVGRAE